MTTQLALELPTATPPPTTPWADTTLAIARNAIDPGQYPGAAAYTNGTVTLTEAIPGRITLSADTSAATSAIRTALLDAGYALDHAPSSLSVTVRSVHRAAPDGLPELTFSEHTTPGIGVEFQLSGPVGCVEQQCGAGIHNALSVHSHHPFPGAQRGVCTSRGPECWTRRAWPHTARVRHLLQATATAWQLTPAAEQQMRRLYADYVHATRP